MKCSLLVALSSVLVALTTQAHAQARCTVETVGKVFDCSFFGKPGQMTCLEPGKFSPCEPAPNPPTPISGPVYLKYMVLTVIYAPPGTKGGQTTGASTVSYESDSSTGSSHSNSNSFKQGYNTSVSCCDEPAKSMFTGSAGFQYTRNNTSTNEWDIKKTTTSTIQDTGPLTSDGVDHNHDQVWVYLHPRFDVTVDGNNVIWSFSSPEFQTGKVQYLYVAQLKDPATIPQGLLQDVQLAGFTSQDYQEILNADPLAQCLPPEVEERRIGQPPPPPCRAPLPTMPRYTPTYISLPYNPPLLPTDTVPLQPYSIDNSNTHIDTNSLEEDFELDFTGTFNPLTDIANAVALIFKEEDKWTWSNIKTNVTTTVDEQKMSLVMGGPSYGYNGPQNIDVYYDTLYETFVFVPTELSLDALHGVVLNSQGKPVPGHPVIATVGGQKYRTYTDAKGQYHFSQKFTGPIDLQVGVATQK